MTQNAIEYFRDDLTDMQKLYCCITGYEGPCAAYGSARDEYYYTLDTYDEKLEHLDAYSEEFVGILSDAELDRVITALDADFNGTNEQYNLFTALQ